MDKVSRERPMLLVGSPMCTAFSSWQRINDKIMDPTVCAAEKARGLIHLSFCVDLYREQHKNNRYFLHEHPASATSWQSEVMEKLSSEDGIIKVTCDQCQYGMEDPDGNLIKKPTTFLTNSQDRGAIAEEMFQQEWVLHATKRRSTQTVQRICC